MAKYTIKIRDGETHRTVGILAKRLVYPQTMGSKNLAMGMCFLGPGEEMHELKGHPFEEAYFILQGEGETKIAGVEKRVKLEKNLSLFFPSWVGHATKNTGNEPLMILYVISPPPTPADIKAIKAQQ